MSVSAQTHADHIDKVQYKVTDMTTILIVVVILMLLGAFPTWSHSRNWGYGPSGGLGLLVVIVIILLLLKVF